MGIRIEQAGTAALYGKAAVLAGQSQRARELEQRAIRRQEQIMAIEAQKETLQIQQQQQTNMKLLDAQLDLEMYERSKRWEIDKMQLRSQVDFQREEQSRQRKLDSIDSAIQQIDKEVLAGRMTEEEAYPIKLKYQISRTGADVPTSLLPAGGEDERFGVDPYWMRGRDAPEGTPERQLYEAKMAEGISGERRGVVPYYLDPEWLRTNRDIAQQVLDSKGIILEEDEIDAMIRGAEPTELPLGDKSLGVGVQVQPAKAVKGQYTIGQTVIRGGKSYIVVGFDTDGEPLVELKR